MYAQLILAFLYLVLFSDIIFKNKNKVEKISLCINFIFFRRKNA